MFGTQSAPLEETIKLLHSGDYYLIHTPITLANTLKERAVAGDQEGFNQVADAYISFAQKPEGGRSLRKDALVDLATFCLNADLDWLVVKKPGDIPRNMYEHADLYGETMNAFATYVGKKGLPLSFELWPETVETISNRVN